MPVLVVTGASSGIGAAVAALAVAQGWQVAGLSRRAIAPDGVRAVACDVTDSAAVGAAFERIAADWGRVDVLFANAGAFPRADTIDGITDEEWRQAMSVNLDGMFFACRAAFAQMRRQDPQGGRIILNGSVSAHAPRPRALAYTVAKHALTGLTRQLALDGRAFGIAAGQIDIGNAATELLAGIAAGQDNPEPMMPVDQAARAVLHMVSLPPGSNVLSMTVMATNMPLVGRG
ncbi:MAG: SDR family oxidoreductase [Paracoccus sp. (in: a-proteobacteria)]|uniref:SDR family oxidoreductase n=1 Tax=Paracoccus sp. TaxID=267 RepID=UPI0026DF8AE9|nr:SDR family oxidoreductase [Paracoccus sp. (in: a-proteobacteria)]MDO5632919.1 SDR family oxidoreductase [Paracoccus sp. (in: a-proteobacteria)]